jgi:anti-sigma regulatory factor (Ser/Thr protein kinase)
VRQKRARVDIPAGPDAPWIARQVLRAILPAWGFQTIMELAELVVSELVTNAVTHAEFDRPGHGSYQLAVITRPRGMLRILVSDPVATIPVPLEVDPYREHGRGLMLIDAMAHQWGAEKYRRGKRMWADLGPVPAGSAQPLAVSS